MKMKNEIPSLAKFIGFTLTSCIKYMKEWAMKNNETDLGNELNQFLELHRIEFQSL